VSNDYETNINNLQGLTPSEPAALKKVTEKYPFFAHRYYLSLIDWDDPNDPIRRAVVPSVLELEEWGRRDASGEKPILLCLECSTNIRLLLFFS
jgi:lysine 2,3-aminomutase